jgi:hypothetical protein
MSSVENITTEDSTDSTTEKRKPVFRDDDDFPESDEEEDVEEEWNGKPSSRKKAKKNKLKKVKMPTFTYTEGEPIPRDNLSSLKIPALKGILKYMGLAISGSKQDLIDRIIAGMEDTPTEDAPIEDTPLMYEAEENQSSGADVRLTSV